MALPAKDKVGDIGPKNEPSGAGSAPSQKTASKFGVGFNVLLVCAILKDISDVLLNLTIIFSWVTSFTGAIMTMAIWAYLFMSGIKMNASKLATTAISSIIDILPGFSVLPMTTLNLLAIRFIDWAESKVKDMQISGSALPVKK